MIKCMYLEFNRQSVWPQNQKKKQKKHENMVLRHFQSERHSKWKFQQWIFQQMSVILEENNIKYTVRYRITGLSVNG